MGGFNGDLKNESNNICVKYNDILTRYELKNVIDEPTSGAILVDSIIIDMTQISSNQDVLPCPTITNCDAPFITVNTNVARYESRCKIIRSYKNFDMEQYKRCIDSTFFNN